MISTKNAPALSPADLAHLFVVTEIRKHHPPAGPLSPEIIQLHNFGLLSIGGRIWIFSRRPTNGRRATMSAFHLLGCKQAFCKRVSGIERLYVRSGYDAYSVGC